MGEPRNCDADLHIFPNRGSRTGQFPIPVAVLLGSQKWSVFAPIFIAFPTIEGPRKAHLQKSELSL